MNSREELIDVALGNCPADVVIENGRLINVLTAEIEEDMDVAIKGERIALVGDAGHCRGHGTQVIDAGGKLLSPGLIDAHFHIESSMLTVTELNRILVPRGVTAIMGDPHEIANVLGIKGLRLLQDEAEDLPLRAFLRVPGQVPAVPAVEKTGGQISLEETKELLRRDDAVALAGDVNPYLVIGKNKAHLRKLEYVLRLNKTIAGQSPHLNERELNAYIDGGPQDSHVSMDAEEVLMILRRGLKAILTYRPSMREYFNEGDFRELARITAEKHLDLRNCLLCIDDKQTNLLAREGGLDHMVRVAIAEGMNPLTVIQMGTLNVAEHFKITSDLGSIAPGRLADIVILDDLEKFKPSQVLVNGRVVAENGELTAPLKSFIYPEWAKRTIHLKNKIEPGDLEVTLSTNASLVEVRIITAEFPKREILQKLPVQAGRVLPNVKEDIIYLAEIDRHLASGNIGKGFIAKTGIKDGAIASSLIHDAHNIIVVGTNTEDMAIAVNRVASLGGGFVAVKNREILGEVALPIAGLISEESFEVVTSQLDRLEDILKTDLGCTLEPSPFFQLALVPLPNIPELGMTSQGLFDVRKYQLTDVIVG